MGLLRRIADRWDPPETRAHEPSWDALRGYSTAAGQQVNHHTAEGLSVVLACVGAISGALASLPAYVYRRQGTARLEAADHPLAGLIRRGPNKWQSWPDFIEWLAASALLRGNALIEIVTDRGVLAELRPIPWDNAAVTMLPSGRLVYDITNIQSLYDGTGRIRRLLDTEVVHLRDRTDDGLVGRSRLHRAAAVVGASLAVQSFASSLYTNGAFPSGTIEVPGALSDPALEQLRARFTEAFTGPKNAAKALVLENGVKWNSISISPEDAELLASRKFSGEELARIFNVPPPLIGILDHSSFTNSETAGRWFAQHTLAPWIRKIEAEFGRAVLNGDAELEIDMTGFLRGDPAQRWQGYDIALRNTVLTVDEVREAEGYNPLSAGAGAEATTA